MNFGLKNFGKIYEADVKLDGITVICGNNNTGKSTVGKALFSFYNSLYDYQTRIVEKKSSEFLNFVFANGKRLLDFTLSEINELNVIKNEINEYVVLNNGNFTVDEVRDFLESTFQLKISKDKVTALVDNINLPEKDILNELVYRYFNDVMNGQIKRMKSANRRCVVKAEFKNSTNELKFTNKNCNCDIKETIAHKAYYINSPFALDILNRMYDISSLSMFERNVIEAIQVAQAKLKADSMSDILDAVKNKEDLEEVRKVLKHAYKGETQIDNGRYIYEDEDGIQIDFRNISAGLKAFALIERLLESGVLKKKDVLILDEPEIHLHSEWQIYYAELIVALQKKFDLTILLVTHSFQFLESLNFFMKKYGISDRGNYYIPEETKNGYVMRHDDENLEKIMHNLSTGTFRIADLEFEYDMEHDNE